MLLLSWKLTFKNLTLLTKLNLFLTDAHLDWSLSTMYFSSTFLLATILAKWMLPARPSPKRAKVTTELVSPVEPTLSVPWSANPCKYLFNQIRWRLVPLVWLLSFYFWWSINSVASYVAGEYSSVIELTKIGFNFEKWNVWQLDELWKVVHLNS